MHGRFAPSPTGDLHLGNLRTALAAWLLARSTAGRFHLRFEDLDTGSVRERFYESQRRDLERLGLDVDAPVVRQTERHDAHTEAITRLVDAGRTYECFCTRREIHEAASAPNRAGLPDGAYPGTCRHLSATERERRRRDRPAALRLDADGAVETIVDRWAGEVTMPIDDVVLRRHDGTAAYHLAVVVDDAAVGVEEVVRADDLLDSSPRQAHLARLLGLDPVAYAHVPLVLGPEGRRLAKRDGAVTLDDLAAAGVTSDQVLTMLARRLGIEAAPGDDLSRILGRFDPEQVPRSPWTWAPDDIGQQ